MVVSSWRKDWFMVGSIAAGMILGHRGGKKPRTRFEYGLGTAADIIMGSMFGAGLAFLIGKTPKGYEVTKGALFGTALWSTTLAVGTLLQVDGLSKPKPKSMSAMLGASMVFGAGSGFLIKRFAQFGQAAVQQPSEVLIQNSKPDGL